MNLVELLVLLVIAAIAGSAGQALAGKARGGLLVAIVLGFVGAWIGSALARTLELPMPLTVTIGDSTFPILWSVLGAALFMVVLSALTRGKD